MRNEGIGSWPARRAAIAPGDTALVFGDERRTYAQLDERVRRLALALRALGVEQGNRVAFHGRNHPAFLDTLFAAGALGAVLVPVNPLLPAHDVAYVLQDSGAHVVVRCESPSAPAEVSAQTVLVDELDELVSRSIDEPLDVPVTLEDLALLPYTSGTTGKPKGVMLTHGNLTWNVVNMLAACGFTADDAALAAAPLARVGGLAVIVLETLFVGGTVVIPTEPEPEALLRSIERDRITLLFGGPDILAGLAGAASWPSTELRTIRVGVVGGDIVPEPLLRTFLERNIPLCHGYGLSEASPVVTLLDERDALRKFGSVGKPVLFVEVRVVRSDGTDAISGETGELVVRGPNVMRGYWNRPVATAEALTGNGWLRTGDAGWIDKEGFVYVVDRLREGFPVGDSLVFPAEIERGLHGLPGIADCAAVAAADGIAIFVVPPPGAMSSPGELLAAVRDALPSERAPRRVLLVDEIPRNAAGKILRAHLRGRLGMRKVDAHE